MPDILTCLYPFKRLNTRKNSFKTLDNLMSLEKPDNKRNEQKSDCSLTLVSRRWELTYDCPRDGGEFRKPGSDVVLHVPPGAVESEDHVVIHAAVCADVDRIRRVLQLPDHEVIVSPLAEYWAGQDFQFECPVTITLPHCLPDNFDPSLVRVYRVSHGHNGQVRVTRVKQGQDCENTNQDGHFPWEDSGHFVVSSEGKVQVFTEHFCGYVCTYCGHSQSCPELVAMAYGSHKKTQTGRHNATVWDKRIDIADFRNDYCIGPNEELRRRTTVKLRDDLRGDSTLRLELKFIGHDAKLWQPTKALDECPAFPNEQEETLKSFLSCNNDNCIRLRKSATPMEMTWILETNGEVTSCDTCELVIDISQVRAGTSIKLKRLDLQIPLEKPLLQTSSTQTDRADVATSAVGSCGIMNGHQHAESAGGLLPTSTEVQSSRPVINNNFKFNMPSPDSDANGASRTNYYFNVGETNTIIAQRENHPALNALPETLPIVELPPDSMSMSLPPAAIEQNPRQPQLQWYPQQSQSQSARSTHTSVADSGPAPAGSIPPLLPTPVSNAMMVETEQLQTFERGLHNGVHDSQANGLPNGNSSAVSELTQHTENGVHSPSLDSDPSELRFRSPQPVSNQDDIRRSREV